MLRSSLCCVQNRLRTLSQTGRGFADGGPGSAVKYVHGLNIKKGGTDPEIKELSDYPAWLPALALPKLSLYELRQKLTGKGADCMTADEITRMAKLWRKQKIKESNALKSKKKT